MQVSEWCGHAYYLTDACRVVFCSSVRRLCSSVCRFMFFRLSFLFFRFIFARIRSLSFVVFCGLSGLGTVLCGCPRCIPSDSLRPRRDASRSVPTRSSWPWQQEGTAGKESDRPGRISSNLCDDLAGEAVVVVKLYDFVSGQTTQAISSLLFAALQIQTRGAALHGRHGVTLQRFFRKLEETPPTCRPSGGH